MDEAVSRDSLASPSHAEAEEAVRTLIRWAGDDPTREGLRDTPARVARAYREMFAGYGQDPAAELDAIFHDVAGFDDMVLVRDISFASHCEHHIAPFFGRAHIAYYPSNGVVGLSKLARVVDAYARRLQTQETLTAQIVQAMQDALAPRGVAVMLEAEHMCMTMRGVQKPGALTVTTLFAGRFLEDAGAQARFVTLAKGAR